MTDKEKILAWIDENYELFVKEEAYPDVYSPQEYDDYRKLIFKEYERIADIGTGVPIKPNDFAAGALTLLVDKLHNQN